ncbi:MAG TPA: lytic murein transglycosylase [Gaiellaceae bacterium]|nr:lytic murein transglycosylase [Gaiellaceae bacterium]
MRRLAAGALAAAVLAGLTGAVTAAEPAGATGGLAVPLLVPSAETPNVQGSLRLPPGWTERAFLTRALDEILLRQLWRNAGAAYGVPWSVLAAINQIESNFGRNMGPSSAGAVGWMQFMPETWLRWGMDASGDGVADPWDPEDAVYAAARYLAAAGAHEDLRRAVFAYNHADWYVADVLELAARFGQGGEEVVVAVDRAAVDVEAARRRLAQVGERLNAAVAAERRLAREEERRLGRADRAALLSERLEREREAVLAGVDRERAKRLVEALRRELAAAELALGEAEDASRGAAFAVAGTALLAGPAYDGDYVFPVGGGPAAVSVPPDHHDYPAADIAAPEGAPVYAFADVLVLRAWREEDARCGIGATFRTGDGLTWTYCHLSYLDPSVEPGAVLDAGAPVGLVGSTGHSTGPHLHLQLQPATELPQAMDWFRRFAGAAFRWQGEEPPGPEPTSASVRFVSGASPGRAVFAVVDEQVQEAPPEVVLFSRATNPSPGG